LFDRLPRGVKINRRRKITSRRCAPHSSGGWGRNRQRRFAMATSSGRVALARDRSKFAAAYRVDLACTHLPQRSNLGWS
jgi:hypothetical protein